MGRKLRVGVIGGGIGGVALTGALAQHGIEVKVFERAGAVRRSRGRHPDDAECRQGIARARAGRPTEADGLFAAGHRRAQLAHRAREFPHTVDRGMPELVRRGFLPRAPGRPARDAGFAGAGVTQPVLSTACMAVRNEANTAVASFADGSEYRGRPDRRRRRRALGSEEPVVRRQAPRFTGHMCYRAVVPFADRRPDFVSPDASFWMGPKGHVVTYYVRSGAAVNIVAVNETATGSRSRGMRPAAAKNCSMPSRAGIRI